MTQREIDGLEWLEPPEHGLESVRARIRQRHRRRTAIASFAVIAIAAGAIFSAMRTPQPALPAAMLAELARYEDRRDLRVVHGSALELTTTDSGTRIYLVSASTGNGTD
ncbi:MAG: hypothetical protein ACNS61_05145 [Candidatus Wenzhouxiangella sp. M2_3B_020]